MKNITRLVNPTYDPFEFINSVELFTIAMLGSFVTWKFMNTLYDNLYEPTVDLLIECNNTDKYYIKIGKYYVQIGMIFKEFIKWLLIIILLMIIHNVTRRFVR